MAPLNILFPNGQTLAVQVFIKDPISGDPVEWDGTVPVSPPIGGATEAKQDVGNTSLASIDSKLTHPIPVTGTFSLTNDGTFAKETGGNLAEIAGDTDNLDVALSTRLKPADTLAKVSVVDTITNPVHVVNDAGSAVIGHVIVDTAPSTPVTNANLDSPLSGIKSDLDEIAVDTDNLALIKAKTDNIPADPAREGGNLATIAGKDFATQTTLALIKAKTDNIDVALSTRTKPADQQHVIVDSGTITSTVTNDGTFATPGKQDTGNASLATIATDVTPFVTAGAGGYVRQDSTATIAKESGGNLATIATKDFATSAKQDTGNTSLANIQSDLDEIKLDTDNLDVALSTRLKPADTLAAVTSITNPVTITNANLDVPLSSLETITGITNPIVVTDSQAILALLTELRMEARIHSELLRALISGETQKIDLDKEFRQDPYFSQLQ